MTREEIEMFICETLKTGEIFHYKTVNVSNEMVSTVADRWEADVAAARAAGPEVKIASPKKSILR